MVLFSLLSACAYAFTGFRRGVRISNDGQFPFCDIYYRHFSPRFFLSHHREIAATAPRRLARILTYCWYALLEPIALRRAAKIVVPSQGVARELQSEFPELTKNKIHVIPNPVDTGHFRRAANFSPEPVHQSLGIPDGAFVFSFCALASFTAKGLGIILEAIAIIGDPGVHLLVIGGHFGEIDEYAAVAQRLHITDKIHFVGLQKDIRPYLWSSHAFVLPSAYETFSLVCFQAAAAGLPIIATRLYGVEDFLIDGVNGWIVERTAESVGAAIRAATASPVRTSLMGQRAQERVQPYDTANFQSRWLELLNKEFGLRPAEEMQFAGN
jgi:glycosyltransferase involved in cell wall biosynthesis